MSVGSVKQQILSIKNKISTESLLSLGIVTILFYPIINGGIYSLFDRFHLPAKSYVDIMLYVIDIILIAGAVILAVKRHFRFVLFTCLTIGVILIAEVLLFPANFSAIKEYMKDFISMCLPAFFIAYALDDSSTLWHQLFSWLYIPLLAGLVYGLCAKIDIYSMWYGYSMMIPMLLLGIKVVKEYKLHDIALYFVLFMLLVLKASRGSTFIIIAILLLYLIIYTYHTRNSSEDSGSSIQRSLKNRVLKNRFRLISSILLFAIAAVALSQPIFQIVASLLKSFGYTSRTVNVLAQLGIFYLGGRDVITSNLITAILNSPIWGLGLCGDSVLVSTVVFKYPLPEYGKSWHFLGNYAHNFILELTSQFGIVLGLGLFFAFLLLLVYAYRQVAIKKDFRQFEVLLLFSSILISMMVSGSYLITPTFWLLLGLIIKKYHTEHKKMRNELLRRDTHDVV